MDNLFFIIFSLETQLKVGFLASLRLLQVFQNPLGNSKGVPDAYSIVAIAKSSSTAGKKVNFKNH